ncbi:ubiquitin-conjugating enzyme family protein [Blastocystis sp. subtype 4]|uniref:ubiquitin-conjugating enzyme family protein n=1 Tax=Blastocystis sp. subtype 4 TaxID=944170 RepID=UPI00071178BE|nr:ubiquitin-conjugating enzyme family protein [Blastocystis sp. subtype 4]KNB44617.1 ubiquitin-conjugating enzyme family protein [Blastocystis sp. subtype 4]|eukprot:XP_014528060.1 ubiquitin-conjugating enzyme family protein [Blastocystis sp. subtype 4]
MEDLFLWDAMISGPDDSPWEGGMFALQLRFPDDYPSNPPVVRFVTPIFHPNVFVDGMICLDIIKEKWSPINTVSMVLTSIQSLLNDPNPESPANAAAASLYVTNIKEYKKRVRQCAEKSLQMNSFHLCYKQINFA